MDFAFTFCIFLDYIQRLKFSPIQYHFPYVKLYTFKWNWLCKGRVLDTYLDKNDRGISFSNSPRFNFCLSPLKAGKDSWNQRRQFQLNNDSALLSKLISPLLVQFIKPTSDILVQIAEGLGWCSTPDYGLSRIWLIIPSVYLILLAGSHEDSLPVPSSSILRIASSSLVHIHLLSQICINKHIQSPSHIFSFNIDVDYFFTLRCHHYSDATISNAAGEQVDLHW